MTVDDALSRLRAGLARDAEIARAAAEQSPRWTDGYESGAWARGYSDTLGEHTFGHIERHSPSRVLRQVEAHRKLIADYEWCKTVNDTHRSQGFPVPEEDGATEAAYEAVLSVLAAIYAEEGE
ncbi:DUF6221 family protein [Nocardia cyriacigeorgica]|uniref:DUF6221 family protein n=1 Tax=Nocardia cyriacigeorgica TaxID=135487 RepID=UPI0024544A75|nr:DUF6221 family protein [Nocardia cyriacigeorgica]